MTSSIPSPAVPPGWEKDKWRPENSFTKDYPTEPVLQAWVRINYGDDTWSGSVTQKDEYEGLSLGYRENFTTCELARKWCDLVVENWKTLIDAPEIFIHLWYDSKEKKIPTKETE